MFAIAWEFLSGSYRAASFTDRTRPEWPPHPDRVFQALVAAWGERGEAADEREALDWLEEQGPPCLVFPEIEVPTEPSAKVFVPGNDPEAGSSARKRKAYPDSLKSILPSSRNRKPRFFPSIWVGSETCALVWPNAEEPPHRSVLERLCHEVVRIGHSSSFVRCWVEDDPREPTLRPAPDRRVIGKRLRVPFPGRRAALVDHFQRQISARAYEGTPVSTEWPYVSVKEPVETIDSVFSSRLQIFRVNGNVSFSLEDTALIADTLRKSLISAANEASVAVMELISGHRPDGSPSREPHIAYLPLGFVGSRHADGHIMGVALAIPMSTSPQLEEEVFRVIANVTDERDRFELRMGSRGKVSIEPIPGLPLQKTLQLESWTGPSIWWATVTPIVMDRMRRNRDQDVEKWTQDQIREMCPRIGLPAPAEVRVRPVSFLRGAPAVRQMPNLPRKDGARRNMVHAALRFDAIINGPVVLGAGRFRGYGLCKPLNQEPYR